MNDDLLTSDIDAASDLVTVATFDDSVAASLVMNRLKHAGLPAVLARENAVTWFWYLSNAIGGIGVQVNSKDAEAARSLLEQHEQLTAADAAAAEAGSETEEIIGDDAADLSTADAEVETAAASTTGTGQEPLDDEPASTERERNANRAARGAVLGIVFLPIQLYALYLLLFRVFASEESLDDRHLHRSIAAGVINYVVLVGFYLGGGLELPMAWFEHQASRLIRFVDEKSGEDRKGVGGYGLDGTSLTFFVVRGNTCVTVGTFQLSGCSATAPVGMTPSPRIPVLFRPHENNFPSLVRAYV